MTDQPLFKSRRFIIMPLFLRISFCLIPILTILGSPKAFSQNSDKNRVRIMFYNVENLFDTLDDTLKDDNQFLPHGVMRWNSARYEKKINSIYKTIIAAGEWSPPEVVAMCEVENRNVINDIIYDTYLSKFNYKIIHQESDDLRGIDVCLIYRDAIVSLIEYRYWKPYDIKKDDYKTRSVLYAKMLINSDTIHLIFNHWPSRRGGVLAGEELRIKIAHMVRDKVDSLYYNSSGRAKVIIMGDFNSAPDDAGVRSLTGLKSDSSFLVNLSRKQSQTAGTYRYRGVWEMIDQAIVSNTLLSVSEGANVKQTGLVVFTPDFLIEKDPNFPGFMPSPTYRGFRYNGGTSDHLPLILSIYSGSSISGE